MHTIFTFYIFIVMSFVAIIHIYWLKGGIWPGKNKQDLMDKVLGKVVNVPGTFSYIFVICCFFIMAILPVIDYFNLYVISKTIFLILAIIFLLRAISMFIPQIAKKATKIFLEYNKKFYSPLCFSISISYFYLYFN